MKHAPLVLLGAVALAVIVQASDVSFSRLTCRMCVQHNGVYCLSVLDASCHSPSISYDGSPFSKQCNDSYETTLNSRLDCLFISPHADTIALVLVIATILALAGKWYVNEVLFYVNVANGTDTNNEQPTRRRRRRGQEADTTESDGNGTSVPSASYKEDQRSRESNNAFVALPID